VLPENRAIQSENIEITVKTVKSLLFLDIHTSDHINISYQYKHYYIMTNAII